eukprot:TRINITY_DN1702_c0_g1_i2.p1 TRINITY_DN1702_c0_g1~~TRINITY_DN1702_c0_g1_i2.p1  ORF type:complete len:289 (+),score=80.56 TRINITY_DN1702_c0_g1_i2:49-915(+)
MAAIPPTFKELLGPVQDVLAKTGGREFSIRHKTKAHGVHTDDVFWVNKGKMEGKIEGKINVWEKNGMQVTVLPCMTQKANGCKASAGVKVSGAFQGVTLGGDIKLGQNEGPVLQTDITSFKPLRVVAHANLTIPAAPMFTFSSTASYRSFVAGAEAVVAESKLASHKAVIAVKPTSNSFLGALWASPSCEVGLSKPTIFTSYEPSKGVRGVVKADMKNGTCTAALALASADKKNAVHLAVDGGKSSSAKCSGSLSHTWQHITGTLHASGPLCSPTDLKMGAELLFTEA